MSKLSYQGLTENKGWFSLRPILSYNRYFNIIVGAKTSGKSTGAALYYLMHYLETGKGWIYTRRTNDETFLTAPSWFSNAAEILSSHGEKVEVVYKGGQYFVNEKFAGISIPLSLHQKYQSMNLSFADFIHYDEFIDLHGRYLGGQKAPLREYEDLMILYMNADRGVDKAYRNEVKIIATGNNKTYYNPLYMALGADKYLNTDTHFLAPKGENWIVWQLRDEDVPARKAYKESVAYSLSTDAIKDFAFGNLSDEDRTNSNFVQKIEKPLYPVCNVIYNDMQMGVYMVQSEGLLYICPRTNSCQTLSLTAGDHSPNYILANRGDYHISTIRQMYELGKIRFENARCKFFIDNYLKYVV